MSTQPGLNGASISELQLEVALDPDAPAPFCVNRDQEQWEAITSKENLDINIIDVYAEWCGPCKSIPQGARSALHIRASG